jgi:GMP synthase (glutamine-hydrolysing)
MKFLVAESEPPEARDKRRASVGRSSGETFIDLLAAMVPGARIDRAKPADADAPEMSREAIAGYDAVFLTGSPLHVYDDTPEVRRQRRSRPAARRMTRRMGCPTRRLRA